MRVSRVFIAEHPRLKLLLRDELGCDGPHTPMTVVTQGIRLGDGQIIPWNNILSYDLLDVPKEAPVTPDEPIQSPAPRRRRARKA